MSAYREQAIQVIQGWYMDDDEIMEALDSGLYLEVAMRLVRKQRDPLAVLLADLIL